MTKTENFDRQFIETWIRRNRFWGNIQAACAVIAILALAATIIL
jgi:hypothetical protein